MSMRSWFSCLSVITPPLSSIIICSLIFFGPHLLVDLCSHILVQRGESIFAKKMRNGGQDDRMCHDRERSSAL